MPSPVLSLLETSTALSLLETRANSLGPLLAVPGSSELALAIADKWRGLTPATARQSAQVSALTKTDPELADDAAEALANLLTFAAGQFNVGKNLNDVQLALLAADMLERYWHWRFDEFAYVLREAVGGRYGTTYDRIDAPTVHGWCARYEAARGELIEAEAERQRKAHRLAEVNRAALLPPDQMPLFYLRAKLEAMSEAALAQGISYYLRHAEAENAAAKKALAEQILAERARAAEQEALPANDETEAAYCRLRADYWTRRQAERAAREAAETGAEEVAEADFRRGPFSSACQKCGHRPDQCLCS